MENQIDQLINQHGFRKDTATIFVESKGHCVYCEMDLLSDWHNVQASALDHLLPKSKYPDLAENEKNWVLGCTACNTLKRDYDPLPIGASKHPADYLSSHREELIAKVREHIFAKLPELKDRMNRMREIIRGA